MAKSKDIGVKFAKTVLLQLAEIQAKTDTLSDFIIADMAMRRAGDPQKAGRQFRARWKPRAKELYETLWRELKQ